MRQTNPSSMLMAAVLCSITTLVGVVAGFAEPTYAEFADERSILIGTIATSTFFAGLFFWRWRTNRPRPGTGGPKSRPPGPPPQPSPAGLPIGPRLPSPLVAHAIPPRDDSTNVGAEKVDAEKVDAEKVTLDNKTR